SEADQESKNEDPSAALKAEPSRVPDAGAAAEEGKAPPSYFSSPDDEALRLSLITTGDLPGTYI
ncbi:hypothetical protein AVEN_58493-1, partial [Araneus ventricosus]